MSIDERARLPRPRGFLGRIAHGLANALVPTERTILTREGSYYFVMMSVLLVAGLYQQVNLILLVSTLAAGPFLTSWIGSRTLLRRLSVQRRVPAYVFSGDPLQVHYTLENGRRWMAALAMFMEDVLVPLDGAAPGFSIAPRVFFPRVGSRERATVRWQTTSPRRGKYGFQDLELGTRAPFGLVERRVTIPLADEIFVYPRIGRLTRRWFQVQRQSSENRMGKRHDRSSQQEEYHGLRDYRSGDNPRWIHWRTSPRRAEVMVKEFEQQNEQDLAILIDPWLPRTKVAPELRDAMEQAVSFAATVCLETCRRQGRRLILGWTGATPEVCVGQASVKLLHELLERLALLRPATEGRLADLFDALPPAALRDSLLVIVSTRPVNLAEEAERSTRLSGSSSRSMLARAIVRDAAQGELAELIHDAGSTSRGILEERMSTSEQDRLSSQDDRRRSMQSSDGSTTVSGASPDDPGDGKARP